MPTSEIKNYKGISKYVFLPSNIYNLAEMDFQKDINKSDRNKQIIWIDVIQVKRLIQAI